MKAPLKNMSASDTIIAYVLYLQDPTRGILKYRRTYRNYFNIIKHIIIGKYPVEAILRNGKHIVLNNHTAVSIIGDSQGSEEVEYDSATDTITISSIPGMEHNKKVKIFGAINNGDVIATFLSNRYQFLPVKGNIIIDIGANIGDTAIYFALCGADRVIGIEPFPKNYGTAKKNIESNNLSDRITMLLAGCASDPRYVTIDPEYESNACSFLAEFFSPVFSVCDSVSTHRKLLSISLIRMQKEISDYIYGCYYLLTIITLIFNVSYAKT